MPSDPSLQNGVVVLVDANGGVVTDLSWNANTQQVTSSTGTNATLTLANEVNPGLMSSTEHIKLRDIEDYISPPAIGAVTSDPSGITEALYAPNMVRMSGEDYDNLPSYNPDVIYLVYR